MPRKKFAKEELEMNKPLLSLCIPTYNRSQYLKKYRFDCLPKRISGWKG